MIKLHKGFRKNRSQSMRNSANSGGSIRSGAFCGLADFIIAEIQFHLELEDRKRASLVNCQWRSAFKSFPELQHDSIVTIHDETECDSLVDLLSRTRNLRIAKAAVDHPQHFQLLYTAVAHCHFLSTIELLGDKFSSPESGWPNASSLQQLFQQAEDNLANVRRIRAVGHQLDPSTHLYRLLSAACNLQEFSAEVNSDGNCLSILLSHMPSKVHSLSIEFAAVQQRNIFSQIAAYASLSDRGVVLRKLDLFVDRQMLNMDNWSDELAKLFSRHPALRLSLIEKPYNERNLVMSPQAVRKLVLATGKHLDSLQFLWPLTYDVLQQLPWAQLDSVACEELCTPEQQQQQQQQQPAVPSDLQRTIDLQRAEHQRAFKLRKLNTDSVLLANHFVSVFPNLRVLNIKRWRSAKRVREDVLHVLSQTAKLLEVLTMPAANRQYYLFGPAQQPVAEFAHLKKLTLNRVLIENPESAERFRIVASNLRILTLTIDAPMEQINLYWKKVLSNCPSLTDVRTFSNARANLEWWKEMASLRRLQSISTVECKFQKKDRCTFCKSGNKKLSIIRTCPNLRRIDVAYCLEGKNDITAVPNCQGCASFIASFPEHIAVRVPCKVAGYVELIY